MRKSIIPVLIFICVFFVSLIFQKYTLINAEGLGLFLVTPDYFRSVFSNPWPISTLLNDFFIQFFRFSYIAQAIVAAIVTLVFLLTRGIFTHFTSKGSIFGVAAAMVAWFLMVWNQSTVIGFATILIEIAALIILSFYEKPLWCETNISLGVSSGLILVCSLIIITNKQIQSTERWSAVEFGTMYQNWDLVLEKADPKAASKDRYLIPYALLALNQKNMLVDRMKEYPVYGIEDLDMEGVNSRRAYLFNGCLYAALNCPNEAVHQTFQAACFLPHGTSFQTLRQLVVLNCQRGDEELVRKYCAILKRSCCHDDFVESYLKLIKNGLPKRESIPGKPSDMPILTHNPQYNLYSLQKSGISSGIAFDRFKAYLLFTHQNELK